MPSALPELSGLIRTSTREVDIISPLHSLREEIGLERVRSLPKVIPPNPGSLTPFLYLSAVSLVLFVCSRDWRYRSGQDKDPSFVELPF